MVICIDIGNTDVKLGLFNKEGKLLEFSVRDKLENIRLDTLFNNEDLNYGIISSTRNINISTFQERNAGIHWLVFDNKTPVPVGNNYNTPQTLGKDRLAAVSGAHTLWPGQNVLVIDAGTCITYDFISRAGVFEGGNISPGLTMRLQAMHHFTGMLPEVHMAESKTLIGKSTTEALQNGAYWGTIMEVRSFIVRMRKVYRSITVVLTGGDAEIISRNLDTYVILRPHLVLEGLFAIIKYNIAIDTE
ncbi:MAG TPA: type III pantothenate kinase [Saprospiraceae bacterium]|nr:type III pantothenate kinase [Saprospiraceae bacterium]